MIYHFSGGLGGSQFFYRAHQQAPIREDLLSSGSDKDALTRPHSFIYHHHSVCVNRCNSREGSSKTLLCSIYRKNACVALITMLLVYQVHLTYTVRCRNISTLGKSGCGGGGGGCGGVSSVQTFSQILLFSSVFFHWGLVQVTGMAKGSNLCSFSYLFVDLGMVFNHQVLL